MAAFPVPKPLLEPPSGADVRDSGAALWWWCGDGIVCNQAYERRVTTEHLRAGFAICRELGGGEPVVLVSEAGPLGETTREARDLLAGPEAAAIYRAMAVVVRSPVARAIMSFFVRFSSPPFPVRVFNDVQEALDWARDQASDG